MAVYVSNRADHAKSDAVTVRRLRCGECSVSAASPAAPSGQVVGEQRFLGLFSSTAYAESLTRIPLA